MDKKAIVTGSGGLIGAECVRLLCAEGWRVVGIDNDMRQAFFGPGGTTRPVVKELAKALRNYEHLDLDIRDRHAIRDLFQRERPNFIIHTAAQPSHDMAASIPYDDFDVNAVGTVNLLVAAHTSYPPGAFAWLDNISRWSGSGRRYLLYYIPESGGAAPRSVNERAKRAMCDTRLAGSLNFVGPPGFEPGTNRLWSTALTAELRAPNHNKPRSSEGNRKDGCRRDGRPPLDPELLLRVFRCAPLRSAICVALFF